ncbi:hypothetical protein CPSG_00062 [Coccidioides posadasii str. Silveira]|uniref:Cytochrome c oxidase assembly factor 3 mitochondrial coiled-coil domain-containing protein n=1 Tax=Coccidioides posadasii (strain RMSCC 757 / Silveira) TaxID=443226 RepID=E9CTL8_COCPS|nr:hypothetical protein CPSG_00062 [Coccidioides posadasii str. Silveira]
MKLNRRRPAAGHHKGLTLQVDKDGAKMSLFRSSYYDKDYRAGAALLRARRPYLVKNALTGVVLFGFCISVCMWEWRGSALPNQHTLQLPCHARPRGRFHFSLANRCPILY